MQTALFLTDVFFAVARFLVWFRGAVEVAVGDGADVGWAVEAAGEIPGWEVEVFT